MVLGRYLLLALCACGLAAAPAHARTPPRAALELSSAGKKLLGKSQTFAIGGWTVGSSAKIGLTGPLRFSAGKRKVSATGLSVTISRTSSSVSAKLGGKSVRLFAVTPTRPAVLDAAQQRASLAGARVALTKASASRLKALLKLRRAPSTATLGKLTVAVAAEPTQPPVTTLPAPAPLLPKPIPTATATATATPEPTTTPTPETACADRFAATPAGSVDWFACDLPGTSDLHSWTDYLQRAWVGCPGPPGSIVASGGATRVVASTAYDHRFPVTSTVRRQRRDDGHRRRHGHVRAGRPRHRRGDRRLQDRHRRHDRHRVRHGPLQAVQHGR